MAKPRKPQMPSEDEGAQFASPACFMHEVDPVYMGLAPRPERKRANKGSGRKARPPVQASSAKARRSGS